MNPKDQQMLMLRFRHMVIDSHVKPATVTDAELLEIAKGRTMEEKLRSMRVVLSLVPDYYWRSVGL
jgi:hypothetical protein